MFGSPILASVYALFLAAVGCGVGTIEGLALASALKLPKREAWKDAVLGGCGMIGGFLLCAIVPWPQNTVTHKIGDTMDETHERVLIVQFDADAIVGLHSGTGALALL